MQKILLIVICVLSLAVNSFAVSDKSIVIKVIGNGNDVEFDPRTIPAEMQRGYLAMKMFCVGCHGQERMITTLRTGISPVTKHPYGDAEFKEKIIKVMRGTKSHLDASNAKILTEFFHFLLTKSQIS